jgi:Spy/CpxP family protein refolding chaperone
MHKQVELSDLQFKYLLKAVCNDENKAEKLSKEYVEEREDRDQDHFKKMQEYINDRS